MKSLLKSIAFAFFACCCIARSCAFTVKAQIASTDAARYHDIAAYLTEAIQTRDDKLIRRAIGNATIW